MTKNKKSHSRSQHSAKSKAPRKGSQAERIARRDLDLTETEKNQLLFKATERFLRSDGEIKDIYGKLDR